MNCGVGTRQVMGVAKMLHKRSQYSNLSAYSFILIEVWIRQVLVAKILLKHSLYSDLSAHLF